MSPGGSGRRPVAWSLAAVLLAVPGTEAAAGAPPALASLSSRTPGELRAACAGRAVINGVPAWYGIFPSGTEEWPALLRAWRVAGWRRRTRADRDLIAPRGTLALRALTRDGLVLLVGRLERAEGARLAGLVLFDGEPRWAEGVAEAPGREPPGWSRPGPARRLLHVAADGCEAAWYRTDLAVSSLVLRARARLRQQGWKVALGATGPRARVLSASAPGGAALAAYARRHGGASSVLVVATPGAT